MIGLAGEIAQDIRVFLRSKYQQSPNFPPDSDMIGEHL
jgi:hypothetical protein